MNHQQFVERVFQRIDRLAQVEIRTEQNQLSTPEFAVEPRSLVGRCAQKRRREIETVSARFGEKAPQSAGIEQRHTRGCFESIDPRDSDLNVAAGRLYLEIAQSRVERHGDVVVARKAEARATYAKCQTPLGQLRSGERIGTGDCRQGQ